MKDAIRRHKWMVMPVGILAVGALFFAVTLVPVKSARSVEPNDDRQPICKSTVCETAAGPINFLPAVQTARLTVHNISDTDGVVVLAFIDGLTGDVLSKSKPMLLRPHQGTFFDTQPPQRSPGSELPAVQLVGGVRFSRTQGGEVVPFGATLQVINGDGKTSLFVQLPTSQRPPALSGNNWNAESNTWGTQPAIGGWGAQ